MISDKYDMVVQSGAMGEGHLPCEAMCEMIRIVKPGLFCIICNLNKIIWKKEEIFHNCS